MLTGSERERYSRQIMIEGFGEAGQEKLKRAKVFIAGAGGIGAPVCTYLAAAGVGTLRVVDSGRVELSNLNRQVLYRDKDIGRMKVDLAVDKLNLINPEVTVEARDELITEDNIFGLTDGCDLIVDAVDNLKTRFILNKTAVSKGIPFFHGAVYGFEGRATTIIPGKTACLKCIYRGAIPAATIPIVGVTAAIMGSIQATEVIKYILGTGKLLTNKLLVYDGLNLQFREFTVKRDPGCKHCKQLGMEANNEYQD